MSLQAPLARKKQAYFATVPPQEILPVVNSHFESSVPGIYVIGDVMGMPLVKVAANQGVQALEKMAKDGAFTSHPSDDDRLDLVVIGGGPAGLSAAVEARKRGLKYVVLERTKVASTVRSFPPGKKVYAEPRSMDNVSELEVERDLDRDAFLEHIDRVVQEKQLNLLEETEVKRVHRHGERRFEVETTSGKRFPTRHVLVAVGRQGQPRQLECSGTDLAHKVTYRFTTPEDYQDKDVLVVGGGNSAIEAALMLLENNRVTLSYRGDTFFRAKQDNALLLEEAEREGRLTILKESQVRAIHEDTVDLDVAGQPRTIANDQVIVLIGTLPPVEFLMDMGLELDGVWTRKRVVWSIIAVLLACFVYFIAKYFVLHPEAAGPGKLRLPGFSWLSGSVLLGVLYVSTHFLLPIAWLLVLGVHLINTNRKRKGLPPVVSWPGMGWALLGGALIYGLSLLAPHVLTLQPEEAGPGPYYLPGFAWIYQVIPNYFSNLYGLYYLLYFSAITVFGIYWAVQRNHWLVWRRNLIIIFTQWTLWWGIPTFLVVFLGRNPWTPLLARSLNAWPLNMSAFQLAPAVGPGDPVWWHTVAVVGVVWATVLTFIIIPLVTLRWGKIYCSYICSCGALAETVGNSYRHRGPKGDLPRKLERVGFAFIALATLTTVGDLLGFHSLLKWYNVWVGTLLAGALAIGLYPFLGQRVWCRMWCPLAFWMNFWGRWSRFKISSEKGKCIDCNICNQYCQMGIDIKSRALQGKPITLVDTPCVGCAECVARCPMGILHLGEVPTQRISLGMDRLHSQPREQVA